MKKVKYIGCSESQINWGSNSDSKNILTIGAIYELEGEEVHSWHTKYYLKGIEGYFNSVCFEEIEGE